MLHVQLFLSCAGMAEITKFLNIKVEVKKVNLISSNTAFCSLKFSNKKTLKSAPLAIKKPSSSLQLRLTMFYTHVIHGLPFMFMYQHIVLFKFARLRN